MSFTKHSASIAFVLAAVYWTTWDYGNNSLTLPLFLTYISPGLFLSNRVAAVLMLSITLLLTTVVHRSPFEPFTGVQQQEWKWKNTSSIFTFLITICLFMMLATYLDYKDILYSVGPTAALLVLGLNIRNIFQVLILKKLERKPVYVISLKKYVVYLIILILICIAVKHFYRHVYAAELLWRTLALIIMGSLVEFRHGMPR